MAYVVTRQHKFPDALEYGFCCTSHDDAQRKKQQPHTRRMAARTLHSDDDNDEPVVFNDVAPHRVGLGTPIASKQ
jgi:hypothetical protein